MSYAVSEIRFHEPETGEVINLPEDLAETLVVGNFTGGTDMVVSAGDDAYINFIFVSR